MFQIKVDVTRKMFTDKESGESKRYYEFSAVIDGQKFTLRPIESKRALVNYILDKNYKN